MLKSFSIVLLYVMCQPLLAQNIYLHTRHQSHCAQSQHDLIKTSLNLENNPTQTHYFMYDDAYFDNTLGFIALNIETFKPTLFFNVAESDQPLFNTIHEDLSKPFDQSKIFGLQDTYSLLVHRLLNALTFHNDLQKLNPEDLQAYTASGSYYNILEHHYQELLDLFHLFHYYLKYENPNCLTLPEFKNHNITLDSIAQVIHMIKVDGAPYTLSQLQKDLKRMEHLLPIYNQALTELPDQYPTCNLAAYNKQHEDDLQHLQTEFQDQSQEFILYTLIIPNYTALQSIITLHGRLDTDDSMHIFVSSPRIHHLQQLLLKNDFTVFVEPCLPND